MADTGNTCEHGRPKAICGECFPSEATAPTKVGPTDSYPRGKLGPNDEGGINLGIDSDSSPGKVIIHFGTPIAWLGLDPKDAVNIAGALVLHAKRAEARRG